MCSWESFLCFKAQLMGFNMKGSYNINMCLGFFLFQFNILDGFHLLDSYYRKLGLKSDFRMKTGKLQPTGTVIIM